jgi:LysR family cyn operon transcriptional activator
MQGNMEWYRVFYWTAKLGSLSRAAEQLFITQPAVSHSIRQLERKFGGRLFFRGPKGVSLTAEGEALFRYVEQAYHFLEMGEKKIAEMQQLLSGEIVIGAGDTLCKHFLLPQLSLFHQAYPAIKIQVMNRTSRETVRMLKEGKIDFGIVNLPIPDDRQIVIRESTPLQDGFVAGAAYKHLALTAVALKELAKQPLLLLEKGSSTRHYIDEFARSCGCQLHPEIELGSIDLLVQFARSGLGIAYVILPFVQEQLNSGELYEIRLTTPVPERRVGIIYLRDMPLSASAQRLLAMLP